MWHCSYYLPSVSLTLAANFLLVSLILVANFPLVLLIPVLHLDFQISPQLFCWYPWYWWQIFCRYSWYRWHLPPTGVVDMHRWQNLLPVSLILVANLPLIQVVHIDLKISLQILWRFEMLFSGAWGMIIYGKNLNQNISWHCPF